MSKGPTIAEHALKISRKKNPTLAELATVMTAPEIEFAEHYIVYLNASKAMKETQHCVASTARRAVLGYQFKARPRVQAYITELIRMRSKNTGITANYVLTELKEMREMDVSDIMEEDGTTIKNVHDWPRTWRINISALDATEIMTGSIKSIIKKLKIPDKLKTLELMGKHTDVNAFAQDEEKEVVVHSKVTVVIDKESYDDDIDEPVLTAQVQEDFNFL